MTLISLHPVSALIYFIAVLIPVMFCVNPLIQATALITAFCFLCTQQRLKQNLSDLVFYIFLFILIAITNPIFSHNGETVLFFLNDNAITLEAIFCGASISCAIICVIIWCKCLGNVLSSDKIVYLFGRATPKTALIISMALRFIPLFKEQLKRVKTVQKTMGLYNGSSIPDKLMSTLKIMSSMVTWSLENAVELSSSMKARGYGQKNRTSFSLYKFTVSDAVFTLITAVLFILTVISVANGSLSFSYYPYISKISLSASAVISYTAYFMLCIIPFIFELKEAVKWKYYLCRI